MNTLEHGSDVDMWDRYIDQSTPATTPDVLYASKPAHVDSNIDDFIKKEFEMDNTNIEECIQKELQNHYNEQQQQGTDGANAQLTEEEIRQRRKAQNRAAQRAFRERKEVKLKELSIKLAKSETERQQLLKEVELLKQQNLILGTENQILHKTGAEATTGGASPVPVASTLAQRFHFPREKGDFILSLAGHDIGDAKTYEAEGTKLMTVSAVWDYMVQLAKENEEVDIDVNRVLMLLKGNEKCHGHGAAYPLDMVNEAIKQCIS